MTAFVTDFVRNGGTYMIINTSEGLRTGQLNRVQRNMLAAVSIPHLLRLDVREIDFEITLHYEITGKKMLSQCLKSDWITMTEFYSLLLQIVTVLDDSKEYMLSTGNYLLDEEHIFVEDPLPSGTVYLVYLPLLHMPQDHSTAQSMLNLVNRLMTKVMNIEGSGIQKIIGLCGGEQFSVAELKDLLTSLLLDENSTGGQGSNVHIADSGRSRRELDAPGMPMPPQSKDEPLQVPFSAREINRRSTSSSNSNPDSNSHSHLHSHSHLNLNTNLNLNPSPSPSPSPNPNSNSNPSGINAWSSSASIHAGTLMEGEEGIHEEEAGSRTEIKPTYIWLGATLLVALIWKFAYLDGPSGSGFYISAGASLAVLFIVLLINSGKFDLFSYFRHKGSSEEGDFQIDNHVRLAGEEDHEESRFIKRRKLDRYEEKWRWNNLSPSIAPSPKQSSEFYEPIRTPVFEPYRELVEARPVEAQPPATAFPATVLLKDLSKSEQGQADSINYLEKITSLGAGSERIPLSKGSFIIGRSEELAQYVEKEAGVSRAHVELMILESVCRIKDLGSRNGTKLNGEPLAPYKDYSLEPGDSFTIAEVTFRYGREIQILHDERKK